MPAFLIFVAGMSLSLFIIIFEMTIKKILGMDKGKNVGLLHQNTTKSGFKAMIRMEKMNTHTTEIA